MSDPQIRPDLEVRSTRVPTESRAVRTEIELLSSTSQWGGEMVLRGTSQVLLQFVLARCGQLWGTRGVQHNARPFASAHVGSGMISLNIPAASNFSVRPV